MTSTGGSMGLARSDPAAIRPQYHFRGVNGQLYAWYVPWLIANASHLPPEDLQLSSIAEIDEPYWTAEGPPLTPRAMLEHMQLIRAADLTYPILVCPDGRIVDGMHRVLKAMDEGRTTIRAIRLAVLPDADFVDVAPDDLPYPPSRTG